MYISDHPTLEILMGSQGEGKDFIEEGGGAYHRDYVRAIDLVCLRSVMADPTERTGYRQRLLHWRFWSSSKLEECFRATIGL